MQNFRALGAPPPDPRASGGWGLRLQTPQTAPPIANFWLRACLELTPNVTVAQTFTQTLIFYSSLFLKSSNFCSNS